MKTACLNRHAQQDVTDDTHILLEYTYNIPFFKLKYVDYGMLEEDSFKELQLHYVGHLLTRFRRSSEFLNEYVPAERG